MGINLRNVTETVVEVTVKDLIEQRPNTIRGFYEVVEGLMNVLVYKYDYSIDDDKTALTFEHGEPAITAMLSIGYYADNEKAEWLDCKIWLSDEGFGWEIIE